jgi:hypothetical protein
VRPLSEDSHVSSLPPPHQPRKLRKARKDSDEGDGGYLSDGAKKKKKDKKDQKKSAGSSHEPEYLSEGGYLSDTTKRGLEKKKKQKDKKGDKMTEDRSSDSPVKIHKSTKKSRTPSDDGDISDGTYLSETSMKKKKTFFRLRSRSSSAARKGGASSDSPPPPVPALPLTPLPSAGSFTRSPTLFNFPERGLPSGGTPTVDESSVLTSSLSWRRWSPPPPTDSSKATTRSLSVDTSAENSSSSSSHETGWHSPFLPLAQTREVAPYGSQYPQSHEPESRVLSALNSREQAPVSAPAAPRQHGVRFAPSRPFGSSPISSSPSAANVTFGKQPPRPKTPPQIASPLYKSSSSSSSVLPSLIPPVLHAPSPKLAPSDASPRLAPSDTLPFLSRTVRATPSPLMLTPSTPPPPHRASPAISDLSIVSSSDFIVPSPRPRFFEDLPPPSPPPTCPLPDLPSRGLPSELLSAVARGRQLPFPARGVLPVQEASRLIERTERTRQDVLQKRLAAVQAEAEVLSSAAGDVIDDDAYDDEDDDLWLADRAPPPPSPSLEQAHEDERDWPDDESVRPDVAQFYLYASPGPKGGEREVAAHRLPDVPDDERSTYTYSFAPPSPSVDMRTSATIQSERSDVLSYYFDELNRDGAAGDKERLSRPSAVDSEHSREMRARLIARVDALYGADKIPPMPKLRQPF